jgi:hypothetical protein
MKKARKYPASVFRTRCVEESVPNRIGIQDDACLAQMSHEIVLGIER